MPCPSCSSCCTLWLAAAGGFWLLLAIAGWFAERPADRGGISPRPDISTGLAALVIKVYLKLVHRMKVEGLENLAAATAANRGDGGTPGRGLVVTVNHAAGIDPLLVQIAVRGRFFIRWLAAADTVAPTVQPFVEFAEVIFINSSGGAESKGGAGGELLGVREAVRHVQTGGTLGIFPEGRIARRPGVITPFQPGIGLMIARSKGLVLPVVLRGVPIHDNTYKSFFTPSRSTVVFMPPVDYAAMGTKAGAIPAELQSRYEKWVGPVVPAQGIRRK